MTCTRTRNTSLPATLPATALLFALLTAAAAPANADVLEWVFFKDHVYEQTADNVRPTTVDLYDYEIVLYTDPNDFATVDVIGGGVNIPLTEFGPGEWEAFSLFGSQAGLDAAFPSLPTNYTISTSGGTLGPLNESVQMGPDRYPVGAPYLTGTSFSDLSSFDVSQDLVIDFGQVGAGETNVTAFSFFIVDLVNDLDVFTYQEFGPGPYSGSFLLPGGTLDPMTDYLIEMEFSTALQDTPDAFDPFSTSPVAETNFAALTLFEFETAQSSVPEPSTVVLGLMGSVALVGLAIRRRRR